MACSPLPNVSNSHHRCPRHVRRSLLRRIFELHGGGAGSDDAGLFGDATAEVGLGGRLGVIKYYIYIYCIVYELYFMIYIYIHIYIYDIY